MTRESKLKMLGLEEKAYELRKTGVSWDEGAKIMNEQHGKELVAKFGCPINAMSFKRAVVAYEREQNKGLIEDGINPVEEMDRRFRKSVFETNKKNRKLEKKVDTILDKALEDGTYTDMLRAVKEYRDTITQEVKNLVFLQQNGIRQVGDAGNATHQHNQDIKMLVFNIGNELVDIEDELCDECRKKINLQVIISKSFDKLKKK